MNCIISLKKLKYYFKKGYNFFTKEFYGYLSTAGGKLSGVHNGGLQPG